VIPDVETGGSMYRQISAPQEAALTCSFTLAQAEGDISMMSPKHNQ